MLKKHLICYFDLLGTEKELKNAGHEGLINLINEAYNEMKNLCFKASESVNEFNKTDKCTIKIKIFSDNVLLAMEFKDNDYMDVVLSMFFSSVSCFQYAFLRRGLFLKGGITFGDLFINDIFALGSGLVDAYKLESKIAIYPRIVLDNHLINNEKIWSKIQYLIKEKGFINNFNIDKDYTNPIN